MINRELKEFEKRFTCHPPIAERRRFIRHPLCFPLVYSVLKGGGGEVGTEKRTTTINVSMGGLLFSAKRPVPEKTMIVVRIPFRDRSFNIKARVVHCTRNAETKLYNIGVSFHRLNDAFKVKLIEQFYLINEFRDSRSMQTGREISLEDASREWIKRYSKRFSRMYW